MLTLVEKDGVLYANVTGAMAVIKVLLGEEPDSYGPEALWREHAFEGQACHRACLDWLCFHAGLFEQAPPLPQWDPDRHPDEGRFGGVVAKALAGFQDFVQEYQVQLIGVEQEVFWLAGRLVGHVDLLCTLLWQGRRLKAVIDLKFVRKILETHRLQLRCYWRCDGCKDAQLGLLYHGNRETGEWRLEPVDAFAYTADVLAVSHAAHLVAWRERRGK